MEWNKGYSSKYYATVVDPNSWGDIDVIEIIDGNIKIEPTGLRCSADLTCSQFDDSVETLIRVWLDTTQDGSRGSHTPLFTGYACSPDRKLEGRIEKRTLQCYSVLLPCDDILLPRGWYAPVNANGITLIKNLLQPAKAIIKVDSDDTNVILANSIVAESGSTNLTMIESILTAIDWRMQIDGSGVIHLSKYDENPVVKFDSMNNDILEPSITIDHDWFNCPNVLRVILDEKVAIAYDYDSNTPVSINNRGREVWAEEDSVTLNNNESLQAYAHRRLKELQRVSTKISYDRRYIPDISVTDVITLNYPDQNLVGNYMISSQSITLGYNAKTAEEVVRV